MRRWLLWLLIAALVAALLPTAPPDFALAGSAKATPSPLSTECGTDQLSDIVAVYTTTPPPHGSPPPIPANTRSYLEKLLTARLLACSSALPNEELKGTRYSEQSACSPDPKGDVPALWRQLQLCATLVKRPVPLPSIVKWELGPTPTQASQPVIFVVGASGDPAMLYKLISTLTQYLQQTASYLVDDARLIPAPAMTAQDWLNECAQSSQVKGAIVVGITAAGAGATDQFIYRRNWSAIEATALYADCQRSDPKGTGVPAYTWTSELEQKQNHYDVPTPLTPLALLLTLGSAYLEFAPSRTTTTVTTRVYPTPLPIPTYGRISQVQTTNGQTINAAAFSSVALGFLGSSITYTNAYAPLTAQPTVDEQTWETLQDVAVKLVSDMNCWQPPEKALGSQRLVDIVGTPRKAPSYNPPPGLAAYSSGKPSAPFCAEPNAYAIPQPTPSWSTPAPTGTGEPIQDILPSPLPPAKPRA